MAIYMKYFLFNIVMGTIPTTHQITSSTDEENRTDSNTDLSAENTEDELHTNTNTWSHADKKKLQHMTEFHEEYHHCFWRGSLHLDKHEKKNIPYEPTYAQICM